MNTENPLSPSRVLIVDDAGVVRLACERALTKAGFAVRTAEDGPTALELLQAEPAEAVLLDLKMPRMTGLELLRVLREMWPWTEVVIMTAYAESEMIEEARKLGAMKLVLKPFDDIRGIIRAAAQAVVKSRRRRRLPIDAAGLLRPLLVDGGWIGEAEFDRIADEAGARRMSLRQALLETGTIGKEQFHAAMADFLEVPIIHLDRLMPDPQLLEKFPLALARRLRCLPLLVEDGVAHVVAADPFDDSVRDELERWLDKPVAVYQGDETEIRSVIAKLEADSGAPGSGSEFATRLNSSSPQEAGNVIASLFQQARINSLNQVKFTPQGDQKYVFAFEGILTLEESAAVDEACAGKGKSDGEQPAVYRQIEKAR